MITVDKKIDPQLWDEFLKKQAYTLFVQSSPYAEFYRSMGERAWIWGIRNEKGELIGGSLLVSVHARRGNFIFLPYGPIFDTDTPIESCIASFAAFTHELENFSRSEGYDFVRCSPFLPDTKEWKTAFESAGYRPAPLHILAEYTWLLDIEKSEETLMAEMNKNHRNLIRRCEREGVQIDFSEDPQDLRDFYALFEVTAKRKRFFQFPMDYILNEFKAFAPHKGAVLIRGYLPDGTLDSAAIFMFFGTMSCYRHAASLLGDRKLPTSYLVQWRAIQEAKKRGCLIHNFWGVAPPDAGSEHPFFGLNHFKKGFGGTPYNLIHCQDLKTSSRYWITWLIEFIRSRTRGFRS